MIFLVSLGFISCIINLKHAISSCNSSYLLKTVENQFDCRVKTVRSDNGPEFKCSQFYSSKGILHQTSCINTPQQNGVAERKHRHLLNMARALLFQSHLTKPFWGDAILSAAYLINRTPTPLLQNKTHLLKCSSTKLQTTLTYEFLDVNVLSPLIPYVLLSLILVPLSVYS